MNSSVHLCVLAPNPSSSPEVQGDVCNSYRCYVAEIHVLLIIRNRLSGSKGQVGAESVKRSQERVGLDQAVTHAWTRNVLGSKLKDCNCRSLPAQPTCRITHLLAVRDSCRVDSFAPSKTDRRAFGSAAFTQLSSGNSIPEAYSQKLAREARRAREPSLAAG